MFNIEQWTAAVVKHKLTIPQAERFETAYHSLKTNLDHPVRGNRWFHFPARRSITRIIYNAVLTKYSGYISHSAQEILCDAMRDKDEKKKLITLDHPLSPQSYAHFICYNWHQKFKDNFDHFIEELLKLSMTIKVTKEENNKLKTFTVNNAKTGHVLKLKVPTLKRYKCAGITLLWSDKIGDYIDDFPFTLSEEFLAFEQEHLLLVERQHKS